MFLQPQNKAGEKMAWTKSYGQKLRLRKKNPLNHVQFVFIRQRKGWLRLFLCEDRRQATAWKTSLCHCNPGETMMACSGFD